MCDWVSNGSDAAFCIGYDYMGLSATDWSSPVCEALLDRVESRTLRVCLSIDFVRCAHFGLRTEERRRHQWCCEAVRQCCDSMMLWCCYCLWTCEPNNIYSLTSLYLLFSLLINLKLTQIYWKIYIYIKKSFVWKIKTFENELVSTHSELFDFW